MNKVTIINVGDRKEPSQEAFERFVDFYIEVVKRNEKKEEELAENLCLEKI